MPYVERYFAPRHLDSSLEPCLKKSKLDYSEICKKTDVFIPLEAPSEKESSSGFPETGYYGSVKGQHEKPSFGKDSQIGLDNEAKRGSSRNYNSEAHFSRKESKLDYSALCNKRNSEVFIPLETRSENCSPSGFSENSYYGSDKSEYEKERDNGDLLNDFDNESKPENSALSKKRNTEEYKPLDQSPSGFSETRYYGSDKGKHDKSRVSEDFQYGFYIDKKPGPYKNDCSEPTLSGSEDSNKKQQILGLPKTDKWKNNNSEAAFSETSTAFIGPLYQPPPQVDTLSRTTNNENSKSPSFRITTVISGKAADKTKSEGGMDYEMWQFYKELHQLEAATDDHNVIQTTDNSQQHCNSHQSNAPTIQEVRDHHNQKPSSQPCKPSALIPPSYLPTPAPISPAEHSTLLPINNQVSWDRPVPIDRTNSSFVSQSLPPPCFQGPPPPTFDRSNSSFVRPSLTPSSFQGPPLPAFDGTNYFLSQSLPPPCIQGPPPPTFDRSNSSFVRQSLTPSYFQGPLPAFDRTSSSFVSQSLPPASLQGPSPPAFDRTNSSFVSKPLPPPCFQGSSPPAFDRTNSFLSQSLPPSRFQGSPPPAFDRPSSSFVSQSLPPASLQGPSPPAFDRKRNSSSFVSKPLPPPCFQGSPPPAFDRINSSFLCKSLPPPCFQGSHPPAFDRPSSSFVSQSLPPASLEGPSPPAFDRTNSFVSKPLPPPCFQGSPPHAFVGNHGPLPPRHNYPLTFPVEDDMQKSPYHENEKYDCVNDEHPGPTTQAPWHSSHVLPENRFSPQGRGFTESFTRPSFESSQHANQREDFYEQKVRHFDETSPQGGNVFHEQYPPRFRDEAKCTDSKRKLLLLRGVPGSGKSTLARILLDQSPNGIVFSTDDYFCQEKGYTYDVKLLGDAHNWNQNR
ncbi:hypothetical protein AB205_0187870, partial [Aquarana catesbeiana]